MKKKKKANYDPKQISRLEGGPLQYEKEDTYMDDEFTEQETSELSDAYLKGELNRPKLKPYDTDGNRDLIQRRQAEDLYLRKEIVKLARDNKDIRPHLMGLIKKFAKKSK